MNVLVMVNLFDAGMEHRFILSMIETSSAVGGGRFLVIGLVRCLVLVGRIVIRWVSWRWTGRGPLCIVIVVIEENTIIFYKPL